LETDSLYKRILLKAKDATVLGTAAGIIHWDMETMMPPGAVEQRSEQLALLSRIQHKLSTDPEIGKLLKSIQESPKYEVLDQIEKRNVQLIRKSYLEQTSLPEKLVADLAKQEAITVNVWKKAKAKKDFNSFKADLQKLLDLNKILNSGEIEKFVQSLENFFKPQENRVKWIELSENRCSFLSMPLDITSLVQNVFKNFSGVSVADSLGPEILPRFFLKRLGLADFKTEHIAPKPERNSKQGDLFSRLRTLGGKTEKIIYHCLPQIAESGEIINAIKNNASLPAAVLFGSSLQVRQFYDINYQELKQRASVLAQNNSGGSNKIFRNFDINPKSVLLVTDKFILKHLSGQSAVEPVNHLKVKTLIICRLPFEQFTHPYQEAVSAALPNAFEDYAMPRALYNFHNLIKFFYTPDLKDIYIIDAKLAKGYARVFKDYYKFIPGAEIRD